LTRRAVVVELVCRFGAAFDGLAVTASVATLSARLAALLAFSPADLATLVADVFTAEVFIAALPVVFFGDMRAILPYSRSDEGDRAEQRAPAIV
jgi:hypothetical protein